MFGFIWFYSDFSTFLRFLTKIFFNSSNLKPKSAPLDDTYIGALIDHVGYGDQLETSESICVGLGAYRKGSTYSRLATLA